MEIVALILGLLGFGFYQLNKRKDAEVNVKLAETKGKDIILERDQLNIEAEINKVDEKLKAITEERKRQLAETDDLTLEERASKANKRWN
jgi:predicted nuclease with TOPRIM domain